MAANDDTTLSTCSDKKKDLQHDDDLGFIYEEMKEMEIALKETNMLLECIPNREKKDTQIESHPPAANAAKGNTIATAKAFKKIEEDAQYEYNDLDSGVTMSITRDDKEIDHLCETLMEMHLNLRYTVKLLECAANAEKKDTQIESHPPKGNTTTTTITTTAKAFNAQHGAKPQRYEVLCSARGDYVHLEEKFPMDLERVP